MGSRSYSTLSDVADVIDSLHITPKYSESGYPMVRCVNIAYGSLNLSETKRVTEEVFKKYSKKYSPKRGDIIITRVGANFGETAYVESTEFCLGQNTAAIIPKGIDPDYLYFILNSSNGQHQMDVLAAGAAQPTLSIKSIKSLQIPRLGEEQEKWIADNISQLNDKIQLNRQTNQTLEQMAQALFKSWFVDFDPVIDNALAAGNPIPNELQERAQRRQQQLAKPDHKSLPDDIRQLFPSEFELTEALGWVPKGWVVMPVSKIIDINPRVSLPKGVVAKFADMKALPTTGYSVKGVIEKAYSGGAKFQNGDVLLARITPCLENGKTGIVDFLCGNEAGFGSTEFITMRKKGVIETSFIACLARDENFRKHCMQSMVGSSGRQRVQNACFDAYHLPIPESEETLLLFSKLTSTNFLKMSTNRLEIQSLTKLRDTLLPKLISGELRLPSEALADVKQQPTNAIV